MLTREQISVRLREVALFQGLGRDDLSEILRICEAVRVDEGEYVFEEGERGDHFYVIVHGSIELRKTTGEGFKRLAVLRAGQAFGEMALLNQTPRSASAYALQDTYLLSVSRAAFSQMLGGDTLSVRLLKNLSKALWATSVRLASQQQAKESTGTGMGQETMSEFNRLLRARLLPRVTPRVSGYDISASTLAPRTGSDATSWDWFVLTDGRPAFAVLKATDNDVFAAQRLAAVRLLLRSLAAERHASMGHLMTKANRGLRAGWIEGLSGPVVVGLVALADGAAEWVGAGPVTGVVVRRDGTAEDLGTHAPALGEDLDRTYASETLVFADDDRLVALTDAHADAIRSVAVPLLGAASSSSRDALSRILGHTRQPLSHGGDASDVSATVITRTAPTR